MDAQAKKTRRISSLDGLRAISICLVLLGHLGGTRHFPANLEFFEKYANFGVRIFFVISGYLITSLLIKEHAKKGSINVRDFYVRRAYRILPAAYVFMTAVVIIAWPYLSKAQIVGAYLYLSNYVHGHWYLGHLWSLSVEEQFYLLWPWLLALGFRYRMWIALAGVFMAPVLRVGLYMVGLKDIGHYFPTVGDSMAMGCLLAIVWTDLKRFDRWIFSTNFIFIIIITLSLPLMAGMKGVLSRFYNTIGLTIMHAGIALVIYHAIEQEYRILNTRWIVWVGTLSYSLYLWQQFFLYRESTSWWTAFPQNIVLAFFVSILSYYFIEKPFLRLRENRSQLEPALLVPS